MDGWRTLIETTTRSAVEHGAAVRRRTDVDGRLQFEAGDACSEHVQGSPRRGLGAERGDLRSVRRAGRPGDAGQRSRRDALRNNCRTPANQVPRAVAVDYVTGVDELLELSLRHPGRRVILPRQNTQAGGRGSLGGAEFVAQVEGLLQRGLNLDDDVTVRMIGSQRLCPA